jgi:hypothetical protein
MRKSIGDQSELQSHPKSADFSDMVSYLDEIMGPRLTAVIAGVDDPQVVTAWVMKQATASPEVRERIRNAVDTASILMRVESPEGVQSWFMGTNQYLDGRSPALLLAEDPIGVKKAALAKVGIG